MKVAVIQFPGSNCDQDALWALRSDVGVQAEYVWHDASSLGGFEAALIPGGFSYGDYLRCGAIASLAPILAEVNRFAREGKLVLGVCNGFQILCEADILPGALMPNLHRKFLCQDVYLRAENRDSPWTANVTKPLRIPIAHGEGRYFCDGETLARIEGNGQVAFRYVDERGNLAEHANPNGSLDAIAGVFNERRNVLGLMPHPERATNIMLGSTDGLQVLSALATLARA